MARTVLLTTLGAGIAVLAVAAFATGRAPDADAAPRTAEHVAAPDAAAPAPQPVAAAAPTHVAAGEREPRGEATPSKLMLPDGTLVPALNGTIGPPPLERALGGRAFSPIVGIERSPAGIDWYVHADGSKSTTEMRWRKDLGRYDALTRVAVPTGPAPSLRAD